MNEKCKNKVIELDTKFEDLGLDSLEKLDIISLIEEKENLILLN